MAQREKTKEEGNRYLHMRNSLENIKFLREPEQSECIEIYQNFRKELAN